MHIYVGTSNVTTCCNIYTKQYCERDSAFVTSYDHIISILQSNSLCGTGVDHPCNEIAVTLNSDTMYGRASAARIRPRE